MKTNFTLDPANSPVLDFINTLSKEISPFCSTIRLSSPCKSLQLYDSLLFIGQKSGEILRYNIELEIVEKTFSTNSSCLKSLCILNNQLVSVGENFLKFWDLNGKLLEINHCDHKSKLSKVISAFGGIYLSDKQGYLSLFPGKVVKGHNGKITDLVAKTYLMTSSLDSSIKVWDKDLSLIHSLTHTTPINKVCFISDEKIVSANQNNTFSVWDLKTCKLSFEVELQDNSIKALIVSSCGEFIIAGTNDAYIQYWDLKDIETGSFVDFVAHESAITNICTNQSGNLFFTSSKDRTVKVWQSCKEIQQVKILKGHQGSVNCMTASFDEVFLFTGSSDSTIRKWNLGSGAQISVLKHHKAAVTGLLFFKDQLVSIGEDHFLATWSDTEVVKSVNFPDSLCCITTSESHIFIGSRNGKIYIRNPDLSSFNTLSGHFNSINSLIVFSNYLFSASHDRNIKSWDLKSLQETHSFKGHNGPINQILALPGGQIASVGNDGLYKVWFKDFPPIEVILTGHSYPIKAACLNSNGWYTLTGDSSGKLIAWCNEELVEMTSFTFPESIHCIYSLKSEPLILVASGSQVHIVSDILANNSLMTLPNKSSFLFFLYLSEIVKGKEHLFKPIFKDYIVMPFRINILHAFAYTNNYKALKEALKASVKFLSSEGENPLTIALTQYSYESADMLIKFIPIIQRSTNPYIGKLIEKEIRQIVGLGLKNLPVLLNELFPIVSSKLLPQFGQIPCLALVVSEKINIDPSQFKIKEGAQNAIEFRTSKFRLPLNLGTPECEKFLEEILKSENPEIFNQLLIQNCLDYLLKSAYPILILFSFFNLLSFLLLILFYLVYPDSLLLSLVVLFFCGVYIIIESIQMKVGVIYYFKDFWNAVDFIKIISTSLSVFLMLSDVKCNNVQSLAVFFSMLRLISFFRLFEDTRYMIRMVYEVLEDVSSFLLILIVSTFTMALAIKFASEDGKDLGQIVANVYLMNFGQIELGEYQFSYFVQGLFVFILFLNPLVMMNLLIATMGNTYSRIQSSIVISNYREIVGLLLEASTYLLWKRNEQAMFFLHGCYIKRVSVNSSSIDSKLKKLKTDLDKVHVDSVKGMEKLEAILNDI